MKSSQRGVVLKRSEYFRTNTLFSARPPKPTAFRCRPTLTPRRTCAAQLLVQHRAVGRAGRHDDAIGARFGDALRQIQKLQVRCGLEFQSRHHGTVPGGEALSR